jgi:nicotinamidase-related amidase
VCVLGTVADRIAAGQNVVVCFDAVASRRGDHRDHALAAMRDLGALVVPVESVLFRMQRQAGVGDFKAISALIR